MTIQMSQFGQTSTLSQLQQTAGQPRESQAGSIQEFASTSQQQQKHVVDRLARQQARIQQEQF